MLPEETEQILCWLGERRAELKEKHLLKAATAAAFSVGRPLTADEIDELAGNLP